MGKNFNSGQGPTAGEYCGAMTAGLAKIIEAKLDRRELLKVAKKPEEYAEYVQHPGQGAKGHRLDCQCKMCQAIRRNVAKAEAAKQAEGFEGQQKGIPYVQRKAASKLKRDRFFEALTNPDSKTFGKPLASARLACPGQHTATAARNAKHWLETDARSRILLADAKAGITDEYLASKRAELLEARKVEYFAHQGKVIDRREHADHGVQVRALELTHRLRGEMPKEEEGVQAALILRIGDKAVDSLEWDAFVSTEQQRAKVQAVERSHQIEAEKPAESTPTP